MNLASLSIGEIYLVGYLINAMWFALETTGKHHSEFTSKFPQHIMILATLLWGLLSWAGIVLQLFWILLDVLDYLQAFYLNYKKFRYYKRIEFIRKELEKLHKKPNPSHEDALLSIVHARNMARFIFKMSILQEQIDRLFTDDKKDK